MAETEGFEHIKQDSAVILNLDIMTLKRYYKTMSNLSAKTTIYLDPQVKKFIQHKAVAEGSSVSDLVNEYFADMLEDLQDIETIKERRDEESISFDEALKELGLTYDQLRS